MGDRGRHNNSGYYRTAGAYVPFQDVYKRQVLAEIELILATTAMLGKLNFKNFTVCINDRNILKAMAAYSGFKEEDYDEVFIILDKMDKIGAEGVAGELEEMGYTRENVDTYLKLFDEVETDLSGVRHLKERLGDFLSSETAEGMETVSYTHLDVYKRQGAVVRKRCQRGCGTGW